MASMGRKHHMVSDRADLQGAVSLAFIGMDHVADWHLAANKLSTIAVVLAIRTG